jgi:hypothetical protein
MENLGVAPALVLVWSRIVLLAGCRLGVASQAPMEAPFLQHLPALDSRSHFAQPVSAADRPV